MDRVYDAVDKLAEEMTHLERILDVDDHDEDCITLALSVAKRVRTKSTLVIKALASERDN